MPNYNRVRNTRCSNNIPPTDVKHDNSRIRFFLCSLSVEEIRIKNSVNLSIFRKNILAFIRLCANRTFDFYNLHRTKPLARLLLDLTLLHRYKFRHCLQNTLNTLCVRSKDIHSMTHSYTNALSKC